MAKISNKDQVTNKDLLNSMRELAPQSYKDAIPKAMSLNGDEVRSALSIPQNMNSFMTELINQVVKPTFLSRRLANKLKELYRGNLDFGDSIHNIFVGMAEAKDFGEHFDGCNSELESLYNKSVPKIEQEYSTIDFKKKVKISISHEQLAMAFRDANGLASLIDDVVLALTNRAEYEELMAMKDVISKYTLTKSTQKVIQPLPTDGTSAKAFAKKLKELIELLSFPSDEYNKTGVMTQSSASDLMIITTPAVKASLDIDLYAGLFNMNKAEVESRIITVDNFYFRNEDGTINKDSKRYAMLVDRDFFQFYTRLIQAESVRNANSLYTNQFMHVWSLLATCSFANCLEFITE